MTSLADAIAHRIEQQQKAAEEQRKTQMRDPLWSAVAADLAAWRRSNTPNPKEPHRG
ncbi:hypothetical protein AB0P32_03895 [Streptomyces sp. NPDC085995]|uniref:hypothetical protein n=1 Tax=Streptomyces sp. NPDC085995 TaxID=3154861 RepID=UPI0034161544